MLGAVQVSAAAEKIIHGRLVVLMHDVAAWVLRAAAWA